MRIYFNGDSHTAGDELENPKQNTYSYRLTSLLDGTVIDNPSVGGAGNDRILRTTNQFLDSCEHSQSFPDLVVIGWSECSRFDWFYEGMLRTCNSVNDGLSSEIAQTADPYRFKHLSDVLTHPITLYGMTKYFHNQIYNLHCRLEHLKIPHLFFMACHSFYDPIRDKQLESLFSKEFLKSTRHTLMHFNWKRSFWRPYDIDGSFVKWGLSHGFSITDKRHLDASAHDGFAHLLKDYLYKNYIIS